MSKRRILLLQGHPDGRQRHLCHALADAYRDGAESAGHAYREVEATALDFPLWLGDMPAVLKGLLEQLERPCIAFNKDSRNPFTAKALSGRSARIVVTMGMPALAYRFPARTRCTRWSATSWASWGSRRCAAA